MVFKGEDVWENVLSLPCMVNSPTTNNGNQSCTESWSGMLFFCKIAPYEIYVVTVTNPFTNYSNTSEHISTNEVQIYFTLKETIYRCHASFVRNWSCNRIADQLGKVFRPKQQWDLHHSTGSPGQKTNDASVLSSFSLYTIGTDHFDYITIDTLILEAHSLNFSRVRSGLQIHTLSYPFGPDVMEIFTNSSSSGIVSTVSEMHHGALFMTDARCLPGSEGGGVFAEVNGDLIGIVLSPMCWKSKQLVGMSICCSLRHVLTCMQESMNHNYSDKKCFLLHQIPDSALHSDSNHNSFIVRIEVDGIWGSGVICGVKILDNTCQMIISTCRHVVERKLTMNERSVDVTFEDLNQKYKANIAFAAVENSIYDYAVLVLTTNVNVVKKIMNRMVKIDTPSNVTLLLIPSCKQYYKNQPVYSKGYGLFEMGSTMGPVVSRGLISNIGKHCNHPILLHSTCLVHRGTSGGGLFCSHSGKLAGITVNHIKEDEEDIPYPDASFSIPCTLFMPAVLDFLATSNPSVFDCMNNVDGEVIKTWNLEQQDKVVSIRSSIRSRL